MPLQDELIYLAKIIGMDEPPQSWVDNGFILNQIPFRPDCLEEEYLTAALKFYRLDEETKFAEIFKTSLAQIRQNEAYQKIVCLCHEILFGEKEPDLEKLWGWKIDFKKNIPKMLAAVILLGGYQKHLRLMQRRHLDESQIGFQKEGVKNSCLKGLTFYHTEEMEASSLAWGLYHVYQRLIRVGCFNYECGKFNEPFWVFENKKDSSLKYVSVSNEMVAEQIEKEENDRLILSPGDDRNGIHIPVNADLSLSCVYQSLKKSQDEIRKAFPVLKNRQIVYTCHSWMLSPQLSGLLNADTKIVQFKNLFTPLPCTDGAGDFLKFVFKKPKTWTDWATLPEDTTLRRAVKKHLMAGKALHCGKGVMVYRERDL